MYQALIRIEYERIRGIYLRWEVKKFKDGFKIFLIEDWLLKEPNFDGSVLELVLWVLIHFSMSMPTSE